MTQQLDPKQVRGLKEELNTLDSMVKIKSIGANLSLDEEGELSATGGGGGGSGVNLYSTLGNNIDGALTQKASTDLLVHTKPDGTNDLISNNKITLGYLPDSVLGQVVYGGGFVPSTAEATLTTNAQEKLGTSDATITLTNDTTAITGYEANEGIYYIATASGTFASISFQTGDWLISTGTAWSKVDNTDAVTGVKGNEEVNYRLGNVNITAQNVGAVTSDNAITTQPITPFVTTSMINDTAVTTDKIQDEAVTTAKIDDGAVTTAKIASGGVTSSNIDFTTMEHWELSTTSNTTITQTTAYSYVDVPGTSITFDATVGGVYLILCTGAVDCVTSSSDCYIRVKANGSTICTGIGQTYGTNRYVGITTMKIWTATQVSNSINLAIGGGVSNADYALISGTTIEIIRIG